MSFYNCFLDFFKPRSALCIATIELENARREKLVAESTMEYARAITKYNDDRIARLSEFIQKEAGKTNEPRS